MAMRFLCLHGYAQNAELFRSRTGALRRALKGLVGDFVFVDAPHTCRNFLPTEPDAAAQRLGWWDWTTQPDGQKLRFGWKESEAKLLAMMDEDPHGFDGILGFSQGAVVGALLCAKRPSYFGLAVLVAGGVPSDPEMLSALAEACRSSSKMPPSLHIYGEADQLIEPQKVLELVALWGGPAEAWSHPGGHMLPSSKELRDRVRTFLETGGAGGPAAPCSEADGGARGTGQAEQAWPPLLERDELSSALQARRSARRR